TLAYTSAALGFYFHAWKTPILMVSSDYPLDDPRANGPANFACAVEFILNIGDPGIYVPYRNRHRPMQVHRGTRLASSLQLSGDFISVQNRSYMQFDNGRFERLDADVAEPLSSFPWLEPVFSERVMMIRPYPGLDYSRIDTAGVDAVLHDLYHSGTACATAQWGDQYSLVAFIEHCSEQGVTVYLAPAFKSESAYQSTRALLAAGAEMIWNMSLEASYAKLLLAYGNYRNDAGVAALLEADIAFEHLR
ncbi:MAG: asparaginase domain-containing protein, partial [Gammaproteobacteria bacterium]